MNSLISINNKFMKLQPRQLISMIKNSKYVKGLEICVDINSQFELKYLDDLVFEIKKENLLLQIHGNSELNIDEQLLFLKKIENYADYLGHKINLTFHSIYDDDKEISKNKTALYLQKIIDNVNNDKLVICLENLNDVSNLDRLEKDAITSIILNNEYLYFTYDLGHTLIDYDNMTNLNEYMIEKIRNVHIHTNDGKGNDHMPIYKNDKYWLQLLKALIFLVNNKYQYNIVYEYDLNACYGDTIEEKIIDYLNSIDSISMHY